MSSVGKHYFHGGMGSMVVLIVAVALFVDGFTRQVVTIKIRTLSIGL
ncbi:MAG: hypothetical protein QF908_02485 [Dehalococcoidia bacterium]|nr:hypothetical protein [Dehalococcoidia bacterium]